MDNTPDPYSSKESRKTKIKEETLNLNYLNEI